MQITTAPYNCSIDVLFHSIAARLIVASLAIVSYLLLPSFPSLDADYQYPYEQNYWMKGRTADKDYSVITSNGTHVLTRSLHHQLAGAYQFEMQQGNTCCELGFPKAQTSVGRLLTPFTRWDGLVFLEIAQFGYGEEKSFAFFPLWPMLIRYAATTLPLRGYCPREALIIWGFILSNTLAVLACISLFFLTLCIYAPRGVVFAKHSCVLFSYSVACVFFSSIYTEPLFCAAFFSVCLLSHLLAANISEAADNLCSPSRTFSYCYMAFNISALCMISIVVALALGLCRSNAVLATPIIAWELLLSSRVSKLQPLWLRSFLKGIYKTPSKEKSPTSDPVLKKVFILNLTITFWLIYVVTAPSFLFQGLAQKSMMHVSAQEKGIDTLFPCAQAVSESTGVITYLTDNLITNPIYSLVSTSFLSVVREELMPAHVRGLIERSQPDSFEAGVSLSDPWTSLYACIQKTYWNVGFMQSYKSIRNIPAVTIALPIFFFCILILSNWKNSAIINLNEKSIPYVFHLVVCLLISVFYMHCQVSNRFLQHCAMLQWGLADLISGRATAYKSRIKHWASLYILLGTVMFSLFLPYT